MLFKLVHQINWAVLTVWTGKMASTYEVAVNIVSDARQGVYL
jgi:hypothetical protein